MTANKRQDFAQHEVLGVMDQNFVSKPMNVLCTTIPYLLQFSASMGEIRKSIRYLTGSHNLSCCASGTEVS